MKHNMLVIRLSGLIALLALFASAIGLLWQGEGTSFDYPTPRGDTAQIEGRGIYYYDTVSGAAQERGNDFVTLTLGIPLLIAGMLVSRRGSMRGHLLLTGSLGFFLYTYASMSFLSAFNRLFVVYVALFSLSLFAFILALSSLSPREVANHIRPGFPRRALISFFLIVGAFLALAWLGLANEAARTGRLPAGSESYTTLVIQALDLGVIVPTAVITAALLWKRHAWGYTLAAVMILKILTMGAALIAMIIGQALAGVPLEPVTTSIFTIISVAGIVLAVLTLRQIDGGTTVPQTTQTSLIANSSLPSPR